jgi:hypothetical protein
MFHPAASGLKLRHIREREKETFPAGAKSSLGRPWQVGHRPRCESAISGQESERGPAETLQGGCKFRSGVQIIMCARKLKGQIMLEEKGRSGSGDLWRRRSSRREIGSNSSARRR